MSHDLGTVTIFRLLGLGFRLGKGLGVKFKNTKEYKITKV
jgi:hypothetical protein